MYLKYVFFTALSVSCAVFAQTPKDSKYPILPPESGVINASEQTQVPQDTDPAIDKMLEQYRVRLAPFKWQMKFYHMQGDLPVYEVTFPSPVKTQTVENNTVYCEYFPSVVGTGKRPTIIVLHILGGNFVAARAVSGMLCRKGYNALVIKLPYYGPRRPKGTPEMMKRIQDPYELGPIIRQAVMDIRRAKDWLKTRKEVDPNRIGLIGMSLGGFTAALTSGVDAGFQRVAIIVAGGRFAKVLTNPGAPIAHYRAVCRQNGVTQEDLEKALVSNEPITYVSRLKNTQVFMLNGDSDSVVPYECAEDFGKLSNACQVWYSGGHVALVPMMRVIMNYVSRHFMGNDWSQPSCFFKKTADDKIAPNPQKIPSASAQSGAKPRS